MSEEGEKMSKYHITMSTKNILPTRVPFDSVNASHVSYSSLGQHVLQTVSWTDETKKVL